jgi:C_GCAxxG_C_C family probable redox protein
MAAKLATSFGGGMGRLREVCGAVSGMFLVLGLQILILILKIKVPKTTTTKQFNELLTNSSRLWGSYICADLLKLKHEPQNPESSVRNEVYYKSRPCTRCVKVVAEIVGNEIL